ncbi:UNVERIFIED_CONTAM: hypothetical protein FKN15_045768 [Acipenser sinensis]
MALKVLQGPPCSQPRATASEDNAALGSLQAKPAGAQPDYRGHCDTPLAPDSTSAIDTAIGSAIDIAIGTAIGTAIGIAIGTTIDIAIDTAIGTAIDTAPYIVRHTSIGVFVFLTVISLGVETIL